jgi:hypothetical protein
MKNSWKKYTSQTRDSLFWKIRWRMWKFLSKISCEQEPLDKVLDETVRVYA